MSAPVTVPEWREFLTGPGTEWPGTQPAGEDSVRVAEQRLGVRLPPSYRNFLLVSDGWAEMPANAGTLRSADAIGWCPEADPEMWTAWFGPGVDFPELESKLRRCVLISTDSDQGDVWVLSADHIGADGEWRAYEWWAGDGDGLLPHDSFGALLHSARDKWLAEAEAGASIMSLRPDGASDDDPPAGVSGRVTTPVEPWLLRGALEVERTARGVLPHRLPARAREQFADAYLARVETQTSGVRVAFRTRATVVELDVLPTKNAYQGAPRQPDGAYDLVVDGRLAGRTSVPEGNVLTVDMATQSAELCPGAPGTARFTGLPAGEKDVEIWLPHTEVTELIALRTDAPVEAVPDGGRRVWLHHGSSISHGSNAEGPTAIWPAVAAALGGVELINLGFGGNALLDQFTARAVRDTPADLISLKIGINLVNTDLMRLRAFGPAVHGFLDTVREGHPTTPLLVVSPVLCPVQEDTPGPITPVFDGGRLGFRALGDPSEPGRLTLNVIRDVLARITGQRAAGDPNLYYVDGRALYGEADFAELPLPDGLHPDTAGHRRIGERFAEVVFGAGRPFAATGG